jgi:hypothetical protein
MDLVLNSATSIKLPGDDGNTTWFRRTRGKLDRVGCTAAKEASYFPLQSPTLSFRKSIYRAPGYLRNAGVTVFPSDAVRNGNAGAGVAVDPKVLGTVQERP